MALIKRLSGTPSIDFLGRRKMSLAFSAFLVLASLAIFFTQGLNLGIDFKGGILMEVRTSGPANLADLRSRLNALDLGEVSLQEFGAETDVLINIQRQEGDEQAQGQAINKVKQELGDSVEYRRTEFVGPKVGSELVQAGTLATVLALLGIALFVWFRYEWQFSIAALIALIHDVITTIGFFALTQLEFNLGTLAAVLTVAGYSINDTVVIFDRVREELRRYKKMVQSEVLNLAINRTLSRTMLTSITTLLALLALFIFGGAVIRGFSAGLIWGILIGTYSSVCLAVPLLSYRNLRAWSKVDQEAKKDAAEKPA
jgi:preprotein translocase SecF subunit